MSVITMQKSIPIPSTSSSGYSLDRSTTAVFQNSTSVNNVSLAQSVPTKSQTFPTSGKIISRCLFGPPDPQECKSLASSVENKITLEFGDRFNFDVSSGEPIFPPAAKKMKLSVEDYSDDEILYKEGDMMMEENQSDDGEQGYYCWAEMYDDEYMARCNKHALLNSTIGAPTRVVAVSLLFAPVVLPSFPLSYGYTSQKSSGVSKIREGGKSQVSTTTTQCPRDTIAPQPKKEEEEEGERNNNNNIIISTTKCDLPVLPTPIPTTNTSRKKKSNPVSSSNNMSCLDYPHHQKNIRSSSSYVHCKAKSLKRSIKARHRYILNKLNQHRVPKRTTAIITDYLQVRRMKSHHQSTLKEKKKP